MLIKQQRVMNLQKHVPFLNEGNQVVIGVTDPARFESKLVRAGFSRDLPVGEVVLPTPVFGPRSQYNAEGAYIKHKNLPKETVYRQVYWPHEEWNGPYERVRVEGTYDIPYERYQRDFLPPPSIELQVSINSAGGKVVHSPVLTYAEGQDKLLKHIINLYLEMFGECEVMTGDLDSLVVPNEGIRRLNWDILPPGEYPWERVQQRVERTIKRVKKGKQPVVRHRFDTIRKYEQDFVAEGRAGFTGYYIFGFEDRNLFICECAYYGNATYVFGQDWETLSKMTKAEILNEDLQEARIVHREGWEDRLAEIMNR